MQLIGMLDSPYVRRVAISLRLLGLPFGHRSISVFREMPAFAAINPVIKAPSLVCDDGAVLMDSTLILQFAERMAAPRTLLPVDPDAFQRDLRVQGLALAACEKAVQIVYEHSLRPEEKRHAPWTERVRSQLGQALRLLEVELDAQPLTVASDTITQGGVTTAVAWQFIEAMLQEDAPGVAFPRVVAHGIAAEQLPEFRALPPA